MCKETSLKEIEKIEARYALAIVHMPVKQLATELSLHKAKLCAKQNQGLLQPTGHNNLLRALLTSPLTDLASLSLGNADLLGIENISFQSFTLPEKACGGGREVIG